MILDTSAVLAIAFREPAAAWVIQEVSRAQRVLMSTVNLTETLILFRQRKPDTFAELFDELLASGVQFIPPDRAQAELAAQARLRFPLNFGDCFAYALAQSCNLPLLTLDRDFRSTDLTVILPPEA
jgi:ribonuclease VapC